MKRRRKSPLAVRFGVFLLFVFGLFLVAARIIDQGQPSAGHSAGSLVSEQEADPLPERAPMELPSLPSLPPVAAHEVQNYALFTHVAFGEFQIMTGTEYGSSTQSNITSQWCYLSASQPGGASLQLSLATMDATGKQSIPDLSPDALAPFGLTPPSARTLVDTHCRFQTGE